MIPKFVMPDDVEGQVTVRMDPEELNDTSLIMHLTGYIDTYNSEFFAKQMKTCIAAGYVNIILACSGLNYISSTGVGAFTAMLKDLVNKGEVVIAEAPIKIIEVFQLLGFTSFFKIFDSVSKAKEYILSDKQPKDTKTASESFPLVVNCPICEKKFKVSKSGAYRCPQCKSPIVIDGAGKIQVK